MRILRRLWTGEIAQDLVEYSLLIAFLVLGTAALMYSSGGSVSKIWTATNLAIAGTPAPPPSTGGSGGSGGSGGDGGDHDH
jgi:Flp pilus assembly pilin Flp